MNKNYLTQVAILFLLTIGILLGLSTLKSTDISFTTKEIDLLSSLREEPAADERHENETVEEFEEEEEEDTLNETIVVTDSTSTPEEKKDVVFMTYSITGTIADTAAIEEVTDTLPARPEINVPRKAGDITLIEDYTAAQTGLRFFKAAINGRGTLQRSVRIAVLGDSFIEADILTQDIRQQLQDIYGGCGVGYVSMHSDFPGFRHSVSQYSSGWNTHNVISEPQYSFTSLPLQLHRPQAEATAFTRFKGVNKVRHADSWEVSKIGFVAKAKSVISVKTDSARHKFDVAPDDKAQFLTIPEHTHSIEIRCSQPDIAFWGTWLDGTAGIAVDNISMRGYSGTTLHRIPIERMKQLNEAIPYDLIILQYGLNSMVPSITDYSKYQAQLVKAITHLKAAFPNCDILIMSIGDRSQNIKGTMQTMKAVYGLCKSQRNAAIEAQCHFWDCCEAMKTLGGMPLFVKNRWAHKDYTHLSHAGGRPLAEEFVKALRYALENRNAPAAPQTESETQTETTINE